jgi:hypothetical protein
MKVLLYGSGAIVIILSLFGCDLVVRCMLVQDKHGHRKRAVFLGVKRVLVIPSPITRQVLKTNRLSMVLSERP